MQRIIGTRLLGIVLIVALVVTVIAGPMSLAYAPYPLQTSDTEVASALNYLRGQQAGDGSISDFVTSAWAVMAIAAAGENPLGWSAGGSSIVDYLEANAGDGATVSDHARMVLAIVAAGGDPEDFGGRNFVALIEDAYDGTQIGNTGLLNDDFWALMALVAAGKNLSTELVTNIVGFIKANQNGDGGWSWGVGQASVVDDTAAAIMALKTAGEPPGSPAIGNALAYIKSTQMDNGGFESWGATNSGTDSWGICSIAADYQNPTSAYWKSANGTDPVDDLLTFQNPDGSFNWQPATPLNMAWMTSFAIPALLGVPYPVAVMPQEDTSASVYVRVEGQDTTLWSGDVTVADSTVSDNQGGMHYLAAPTVLGALVKASLAGGFPYVVRDFGWALAVTSIGGDGDWDVGPWWLYRVDYKYAEVGMAEFILNETTPPVPPHLEILIYTSSTWSELPLRISLNIQSVLVNQGFIATVTYYDDGTAAWLPLEGATVHADQDYLTGIDGTVVLSIGQVGTFELFAECEGFIRSDRVKVGVIRQVSSGWQPSAPAATSTPTPTPTPVPGELNLGGGIDGSGVVQQEMELTSENGMAWVEIAEGTIVLSAEGIPLETMEVKAVDEPPAAPAAHIIGLAYDLGPDGATFDPPLTIALEYDPSSLPEGIAEENLVIAYFDVETGEWVELDSVVDTQTNTVTAQVSHLTLFTVLGSPPPTPTATQTPQVTATPAPTVTLVATATPVPTTPAPAEPDSEASWGLVGGIIAAFIVIGLGVFAVLRRK